MRRYLDSAVACASARRASVAVRRMPIGQDNSDPYGVWMTKAELAAIRAGGLSADTSGKKV